jgi:hypothetical protein
MGCVVELDSPKIRFDFMQNRLKQKTLIDALLRYSKLDLNNVAQVLDINPQKLMNVYLGEEYFEKESAEELGRLFLIFFSE